jgi:hypothetical protein
VELVTAVVVTRGDVDLAPILASLSAFDEVIVWDNSEHEDLSVYGRYAAITKARNELILTQDDDVIASDPQAIVDAWQPGHVVCNMPQEFRPHYPDSALVGFGACFERDLPEQAFERFGLSDAIGETDSDWPAGFFYRTCDVVFTTLTPRILVDVPKTDREFASDPGRMWTSPGHSGERARMLELARKVRDTVTA